MIVVFAFLIFQLPVFCSGRHPGRGMSPSADSGEEGNLEGAISATPPISVFNEIITTRYCPVCGKAYPSTYTVCPTHGVALKYKCHKGKTMTHPVQAPPVATPAVLYCPACGMQYTADYSFCPRDGTKLELIK